MTAKVILDIQNVSRRFGGIRAVDNVSLTFREGEIVGLIGPNGAGKTTLVNLISGFLPVSDGRITYDGRDITGMKPHLIARSGVARTFQIVQPFARMTVLENVMSGSIFASGHTLAEARRIAHECLAFTQLTSFADSPASELALANRKRLELAKSLAMQPKILMLDEVNAGLNSSEIQDAMRMIKAIAARGITIIVIEHLMRVVATLAERVVVLHHGSVLRDGETNEVFQDPKVVEAYLGAKFASRFAASAAQA
jgi:branched-chain amino acid transport system ATP-binding protein